MKRFKSRNEAILDLTAPLIETSVYKVPSQRENLGSCHVFFELSFVLILKREFLENISLKGRRRIDPKLIYKLVQTHLRSSKVLACCNRLAAIWIETMNGSGSWLGGTW